MAKYMVKVSYSADGIKGVMKEGGTSRVAIVEKALAGVGGKLESFYFAFGESDVYLIAELPDHASAMAVAAAVGASGALSSYETIVLVSPKEVDEAMKKTVSYTAPGA